MPSTHYDADDGVVRIGSIMRPKDSRSERLIVVDMNYEQVIGKNIRSGEVQNINPRNYLVTNP